MVREKRKETERAGGCGAESGGEEVHQILLGMGHFPKMLLLCHPAVLCLPPPLWGGLDQVSAPRLRAN